MDPLMRIPAYLRRSRHGIFYFRIVVPLALRAQWSGRSEIKCSLKTRDQRQALRRARDMAIAAHRWFEYAYADMSAKPFDPNDQSTWPTADDVRRFEKTVETFGPDGRVQQRFHIKADPNSPGDIAAARAEATRHHVRERMMRAPNSPEAQAFFKAEDEEIRRDLEHQEQMRAAALRNLARDAQVSSAAEFQARPSEPARQSSAVGSLAGASADVPAPPRGRSGTGRSALATTEFDKKKLSTLFERFLRVQIRKGSGKRRPAHDAALPDGPAESVAAKKSKSEELSKSNKTYRMKFETFLEWFGDTHIEDVTPEDISDYKQHLMDHAVVRAGRRIGQVGLDLPTVDNYVGVLNGLFTWAQKEGIYPQRMLVPTASQRLVSKRDKRDRARSGKANRAFKTVELNKAFDPKTYKTENRLAHHFWPPLIALFTGMRLGEVSQLACEDIRFEEGLWVIDINDEDYKRLKSHASRRVIPMHHELISLGLPEFVADMAALQLGPKLFPAIIATENGDIGNAPGKKWDLYLKAAGWASLDFPDALVNPLKPVRTEPG